MKPLQPKGASSKGDNKKLQKNIRSLMKQRKSQFGTCSGSGQGPNGKPKRGRPKKAPELPDPNLKTFCDGHASRKGWIDVKEKVPIEGSETKVKERPKAPFHPSRSHQTSTIKIDMVCEEKRKRRRGRKSSSVLVNLEVDANKAVKMGKIEVKNKEEAKGSEETAVIPSYVQDLLGSDVVLPSTSMASASSASAPKVENEVLVETVDPFTSGLPTVPAEEGLPEVNAVQDFGKEKEKKSFFFYQDTMKSDTEDEIEVGVEARSGHRQEFMEVQTAACPSPLSSISTASLESDASEFTSSTVAHSSPMTSAVSERQSTSPVPSDQAISTATATSSVSPISPAPVSPAIPVIDGPLTIDQLRQYLAGNSPQSPFIPPPIRFFVTSDCIPREYRAGNEFLEDGKIEDAEEKQEHIPSAFVRYTPP